MNVAFANLATTLQSDFLTKWQQYEQQALDLRPTWPETLQAEALEEMIRFIQQERSATEKRIDNLNAPSPVEANAVISPQRAAFRYSDT